MFLQLPARATLSAWSPYDALAAVGCSARESVEAAGELPSATSTAAANKIAPIAFTASASQACQEDMDGHPQPVRADAAALATWAPIPGRGNARLLVRTEDAGQPAASELD